jgi:hypothetical protein
MCPSTRLLCTWRKMVTRLATLNQPTSQLPSLRPKSLRPGFQRSSQRAGETRAGPPAATTRRKKTAKRSLRRENDGLLFSPVRSEGVWKFPCPHDVLTLSSLSLSPSPGVGGWGESVCSQCGVDRVFPSGPKLGRYRPSFPLGSKTRSIMTRVEFPYSSRKLGRSYH